MFIGGGGKKRDSSAGAAHPSEASDAAPTETRAFPSRSLGTRSKNAAQRRKTGLRPVMACGPPACKPSAHAARQAGRLSAMSAGTADFRAPPEYFNSLLGTLLAPRSQAPAWECPCPRSFASPRRAQGGAMVSEPRTWEAELPRQGRSQAGAWERGAYRHAAPLALPKPLGGGPPGCPPGTGTCLNWPSSRPPRPSVPPRPPSRSVRSSPQPHPLHDRHPAHEDNSLALSGSQAGAWERGAKNFAARQLDRQAAAAPSTEEPGFVRGQSEWRPPRL